MADGRQKKVFLESEGDAYHRRNVGKYSPDELDRMAADDEVIKALRALKIVPVDLLEVGCGAASRLECIRKAFGTNCHGIEPSQEAVLFARQSSPGIHVEQGVASEIPFEAGQFDTVVMGFCLYLCDREDLFKIAYEADRVLRDGGFLMVFDFVTAFPYANPYKHRPGLLSYKMDYSMLFRWNPAYRLLYHTVFTHNPDIPAHAAPPDEHVAVSVLHKNLKHAWPPGPDA